MAPGLSARSPACTSLLLTALSRLAAIADLKCGGGAPAAEQIPLGLRALAGTGRQGPPGGPACAARWCPQPGSRCARFGRARDLFQDRENILARPATRCAGLLPS